MSKIDWEWLIDGVNGDGLLARNELIEALKRGKELEENPPFDVLAHLRDGGKIKRPHWQANNYLYLVGRENSTEPDWGQLVCSDYQTVDWLYGDLVFYTDWQPYTQLKQRVAELEESNAKLKRLNPDLTGYANGYADCMEDMPQREFNDDEQAFLFNMQAKKMGELQTKLDAAMVDLDYGETFGLSPFECKKIKAKLKEGEPND